jgi:hypothetical protein
MNSGMVRCWQLNVGSEEQLLLFSKRLRLIVLLLIKTGFVIVSTINLNPVQKGVIGDALVADTCQSDYWGCIP